MRRVRWLALTLVMALIAALGIATLVSAHRSPDETLGGGAAWALGLQLLAGLGVSSAGAYLVWQGTRRRAGLLLVATGPAVFLEQLPLPGHAGSLLFTAALVGGATTSALAGAAALAAPGVGRCFPDLLVAGLALVITTILLGVLPTILFDPRASGCFACSRNLLLVDGDAHLHDGLIRVGLPAAALACGVLALLALISLLGRRGLTLSTSTPVLAGGAAVAALGAAIFAHDAGAGVVEIDSGTRALWLIQCGTLLVAAAGVAALSLRARLLRDRVAAIVIAALPPPGTLRATLAAALGDPRLEIVFPRAGGCAVDCGRPRSRAGSPRRGGHRGRPSRRGRRRASACGGLVAHA